MIINIFILSILMFAAYTDIKTRTIPDYIHLVLIALGIIKLIKAELTLTQSLLGFFVLGLPLLIIGVATNGIGGGDIKLCACIGMAIGIERALFGLLIALVIMLIYTAIQKIRKKKPISLAFAPFIAIGASIFIFI